MEDCCISYNNFGLNEPDEPKMLYGLQQPSLKYPAVGKNVAQNAGYVVDVRVVEDVEAKAVQAQDKVANGQQILEGTTAWQEQLQKCI